MKVQLRVEMQLGVWIVIGLEEVHNFTNIDWILIERFFPALQTAFKDYQDEKARQAKINAQGSDQST